MKRCFLSLLRLKALTAGVCFLLAACLPVSSLPLTGAVGKLLSHHRNDNDLSEKKDEEKESSKVEGLRANARRKKHRHQAPSLVSISFQRATILTAAPGGPITAATPADCTHGIGIPLRC
jgi:hypothetical protein